MQVVDKTEGDTYTPDEFTQFKNESQNAITHSGQTPSAGSQIQLSQAIARYSTVGDAMIVGGSANSYTMTKQGAFQAPTALQNGARYRGFFTVPNTGPTTVNINATGVKDVKKNNYTSPLASGDIVGGWYEFIYSSSDDSFELIPPSVLNNPFYPKWDLNFSYSTDELTSGVDGKTYVSQQNTNAGNDPTLDDGTWWKEYCENLDTFNNSLATNGYQKLPNGLIIQWGQVNQTSLSQSVSFPTTFPNAVLNIQYSRIATNAVTNSHTASSKTVGGFTSKVASTDQYGLHEYLAIGY